MTNVPELSLSDTIPLNGVFNVFNFKTRTPQTLSHVGIVGQSSTKHSTRSNCMRSTSSYIRILTIDSELRNSSHSKVLVSVKGGELQAAEYEELKAAQEAFEAEEKAWVKVTQTGGQRSSFAAGN